MQAYSYLRFSLNVRKIFRFRRQCVNRVQQLLLRDGPDCQLCGLPFPVNAEENTPFSITIDHIVPRKYGGKSTFDNVRLAHRICNNRRGHELDGRWSIETLWTGKGTLRRFRTLEQYGIEIPPRLKPYYDAALVDYKLSQMKRRKFAVPVSKSA